MKNDYLYYVKTITQEYNKRLEAKTNKIKKSGSKGKVNIVFEEEQVGEIQLSDIINQELLKKAVDSVMATLKVNEQYSALRGLNQLNFLRTYLKVYVSKEQNEKSPIRFHLILFQYLL